MTALQKIRPDAALALISPVDAIYRAMRAATAEDGVEIDHFVSTVADGTAAGGGHIVLRAGPDAVILGQNFTDGSWTIIATDGTDREVVSTHVADTPAAELASAAIAAFLDR
jgi:hypothetical protein